LEQCRYCSKTKLYPSKSGTRRIGFWAEDYVYSSTIDYAGGKGMLDIFVIE